MRNEPVTAGPPSATYRMRKFVRRHQAGVGTAAAAVLVLVAFAATMAFQARRIATERDRANREREVSDRVADFQASGFVAEAFGEGFRHVFGQQKLKELRTFHAQVSTLEVEWYLRQV